MIIPLIVFLIASLMIFYETKRQGRKWPKVRGWWARAILLNGAQVGTVYLAGLSWDRWLIAHQSWSLSHLGKTAGALLGYLTITFVFYWWHRLRHKSDFLWRWVHQVHHSPKRLEILTAFYKHPFELIADSILCSIILYPLLGLSPIAAAYAVILSALAELFYHWNVPTPYWVGFFFQRPESHCIHHQDGVHSYNYADLPLWDMLFGTFRNPRSWNAKCGLGEEGEHRLPEMLLGIDVYKTKHSSLKKRLKELAIPSLLIGLGSLQMIADLAGVKALRGIAMAANASPAPKVFCSAKGLETFSSTFEVASEDGSFTLTPELASKIHGPYNRRNIYGAVLSYGPVLEAEASTRSLYLAVLSECGPLFRELGIDPGETIKVSVTPRPGTDASHLNLTQEAKLQ